jgi:hypothetical protein
MFGDAHWHRERVADAILAGAEAKPPVEPEPAAA